MSTYRGNGHFASRNDPEAFERLELEWGNPPLSAEELAELFEHGLLQVDGPMMEGWDGEPDEWSMWDGVRWTLADLDRPAA
jgi:hypothetical protein